MQGAQGNVKKRVVSGLPGAKVRCGTEHLSGSSQISRCKQFLLLVYLPQYLFI